MVPVAALCKIGVMKAKALIRQRSTESTPLPSEDFAAAAAADARVMRMLHGHNPLYWHHQIHHLFSDAGLSTRRIEHVQHHPDWQAWLTVEDFPLAPDNDAAAKQLWRILCDGGLKVVNNQLNIVDRRGDKLRIAFRLDLGSPEAAT